MKRVGELWPQVLSHANLFEAVRRAALGKKSRPDVAAFLCGQEIEVVALQRELLSGIYQPGVYRVFEIREPKPRRISAAPFRDRVVHHALTQVLEPIFERRFLPVSFACRSGLGSHAAVGCVQCAARLGGYALRCDIRKYFASIDHQILQAKLERVVRCKPTLDLASRIIDGSNPQEQVDWYFPGDNLFTPAVRRRGLPLGNQTSQFFANVYLNSLDHLVIRQLRPTAYARYVDDFVLLDQDKEKLRIFRSAIEQHLVDLRLCLHPGKSRIYRVCDGLTFLGWRIFPDHRRLVRGNVVRFRRRLNNLQHRWKIGDVEWDEIHQSLAAWIGHAKHGDTWKLREQIFDQVAFSLKQFLATSPPRTI